MPVTSRWEKSGYIVDFSDPANFRELINANSRFFEDERSDSCRYVIYDLSGVSSLKINDRDLEDIAASDFGGSFSIKRLKVALVTDNVSVRNLCEQYISIKRNLKSPWSYFIFDDIENARKWIST
jgi:hypothetical protein